MKRKTTQARRQAKPARPARQTPPLESAGDWEMGNNWVKVGLAQGQLKTPSLLAKRCGFKESPTATAARMLVCVGLVDLPRTTQLIEFFLSCAGRNGALSCGTHFEAYAKEFLASRGIRSAEQAAKFRKWFANHPPLPSAG